MRRILVIILAVMFLGVGIVSSSENCVCAECGKKCGSGHEKWCSSYPKVKIFSQKKESEEKKVDPKDLKKHDPKPPKLEKNPPPPVPDPPKKEPSFIEKEKKKLRDRFEPERRGPGAGAVRG